MVGDIGIIPKLKPLTVIIAPPMAGAFPSTDEITGASNRNTSSFLCTLVPMLTNKS
jgi:hypothetical protein